MHPEAGSRPVAQPLPFVVEALASEEQLREVRRLRAAAYGHHLPALAEAVSRIDPLDHGADTVIFIARDKASGEVIGTVRIEINRSAPLTIESSMQLPQMFSSMLLAEVTRLAVRPGSNDRPVRMALVKAAQLYCQANQVSGMVAGARPSLTRIYRYLGFVDLYGDDRLMPLAHAGGVEHRIWFLDVVTAESTGRQVNPVGHNFIFRTFHPDILIFGPRLQDRAARHAEPMPMAA
jgi:hypothetical protein